VLSGLQVLYISYNGMLDPLGQTQVLPYLKELAGRGVEFTLLSFERKSVLEKVGPAGCEALRTELAAIGINWRWLRYHKRFSIIATSYDVLVGLRYASRLAKNSEFDLIHARSHIPAAIGWLLKKRLKSRFVFDVRGLMAEEYIDAGHWDRKGIKVKLTKAVERRSLAAADGVVTLTARIWTIIKDWDGLRGRKVVHEVVPCCADLRLFCHSASERAKRRAELGLGDQLTIVYSGSIDGWYLTEQMADFFVSVLKNQPDAHFLWLASARDRIAQLMRARQIPANNYTVKFVNAREVPSYLSASDIGLAFITPAFSKLASSPTKFAEYLACGLPIITNTGIGDSDELLTDDVAVLVKDFHEGEYSRSLEQVRKILENGREAVRLKARAVAEELFDVRVVGVQRYSRLYERLLNTKEN
jgi:glycosyltransferase involved in cell wall biosynthesis